MNLSLSFITGMIASINPCGFVLLPTYLMYFLGVSATDQESQRAPIRRALLVGGAVSSGFIVVFFAIGAITQYWTTSLLENAKYATAVIGLVFVVLGIAMLFGYKLPFVTPSLQTDKRDRTIWSMFVYGIAYATASLGCTLPLFISTLFKASKRAGYWSGRALEVLKRQDEASPDAMYMFARSGDFSIAKAQRLLGYQPKMDLATGLKHSETWMRETGQFN